ncbi:MAG: magnesium transporter CorA family protein [Planctomycetes bacterium]|nr:magnesium transporter CorA family protein [Planctomycetota bacterium]
MLRVHHRDGAEWRTEEGLAAAATAAAARDRESAWIEAIAPDATEQELLRGACGLPSDWIAAALEPEHPPRLVEREGLLFAIAHAPNPGLEVATRKVSLILGPRLLVSIVRLPMPLLDPLHEVLRANPAWYLAAPERIVHAVLHHLADIFEERIDESIDLAEELEDGALDREKGVLRRLHHLRRRTAAFARVLRSQRDVCQALARGGHPLLSREIEPYLRDVADHMLRIYDLLEAVRDGILAARDGHLTAMNHELNVTMRTLTAVATMLLPLSLIAAIYGMNFEHLPLSRSPWGLPVLLGVMVAVAFAVWRWLHRQHWL